MLRPDPVEPFHAIRLSRLARQLVGEGRSIIHMEFGQPSTGAPAAAIARAQHVLATDPGSYWESEPLKARIAQLYADRHGVSVAPERIILTCGASPALVLALSSAFRAGDVIAMARPGYVAYRNSVRALGMTALEIPCGAESRYQITAAHLAALETTTLVAADAQAVENRGDARSGNLRIMRLNGRNRIPAHAGARRIVRFQMIGVEFDESRDQVVATHVLAMGGTALVDPRNLAVANHECAVEDTVLQHQSCIREYLFARHGGGFPRLRHLPKLCVERTWKASPAAGSAKIESDSTL